MDVATILTPFFGKESSYQSKKHITTRKGQMFFIAAIFMIIGVVLLRGLLTLPTISQEKAFQESTYLDRTLGNIQQEYEIISGIASAQANASLSGAAYLHNFSRIVRNDMDARILYVLVASNGTDQSFNVVIGNFLKGDATGTISATNSTPSSAAFSLPDGVNTTLSFAGANEWINLTLNYTIGSERTVEKFYFNDSTRNYIAGFFDVTLIADGVLVRSKNYYNRTL